MDIQFTPQSVRQKKSKVYTRAQFLQLVGMSALGLGVMSVLPLSSVLEQRMAQSKYVGHRYSDHTYGA